jgi:phage terminase small subunit
MPPQTSDQTPTPGTVVKITRIATDRYRPVHSDAGSPTGSQRPPSPSHTGPRNTWSDGTSSHIWHHPATLPARLRPPQSLGESGRAFWRRVTTVYQLSPAEEAMLARCCRTLDVLDRLDATLLDADDLMVTGSVGQLKPHPAIAAAADQQRLLDQLIRSLNLPLPGEEEGRRRTPTNRENALARWRTEGQGRRRGTVA